MEQLTFKEVTKALECCIKNNIISCQKCPLDKVPLCHTVLKKAALNLIYNQYTDIGNLEIENESLNALLIHRG